ncbi:MAG: DCC1-like thiol-disulfide oxidoreductase family protein [Pseudomonadota bacterium]
MRYLIYDGGCPFCARYVDYLNLKRRFPDLELIDAREYPDHEAVRLVRASGKLVDDGMAIVDGDDFIHGANVIQELSQGSAHGALFKSDESAKRNYSMMTKGRSALLKLMGRTKLGF